MPPSLPALSLAAAALAPTHAMNWYAGWALLLAGFATGALLGLGFHRAEFLGGYGSFRRRLFRLGHIACCALGILNIVFALSPWPAIGSGGAAAASLGFAVGGAAMPAVCFLAGWKEPFRHAFAIPVGLLVTAVVATLASGG